MIERIVPLLFLALGLLLAQTPKHYGTGESYTSSAEGVDALYANPARLGIDGYYEIMAGASKLRCGVADDLVESFVLYSSPKYKLGAYGIGFSQFVSSAFSKLDIVAGGQYTVRLNGKALSLGIAPHLYRIQYENYDPTDPFFIENGNSKVSFGLDGGAEFVWNKIAIGFVAHNIVQPDIALNPHTSAKLPFGAVIAASYQLKWGITPGIAFVYDGEQKKVKLSAGAYITLLLDYLSMRAGLYENDMSIGAGLTTPVGRYPLSFDYTFSYPTGELARAKLPSHHFSMGVRLPRPVPKRILPDLVLTAEKTPSEFVKTSEDVQLPVTVHLQKGSTTSKAMLVATLSFRGKMVAAESLFVPETGELTHIFSFRVDSAGKYTISAVVDPNNKIAESDEANNEASVSFEAVNKVVGKVSLAFSRLELEQLTYISEEEPFVPIVFFERGSNKVEKRFAPTIATFVKRLANNPDVKLLLTGYVDPSTDTDTRSFDELAEGRTEAVADELVSRGISRERIVIADTATYNVEMPRITSSSPKISEKERYWISQENRRVEITPTIEGKSWIYYEWAASKVSDEKLWKTLSSRMELVRNNPMLSVSLQSNIPSKRLSQLYPRYDAIRNQLNQRIRQRYRDFAGITLVISEGSPDSIGILISPEKLIYAPVENALAAKNFNIPDKYKHNKISIDISGERAVAHYNVNIVDITTGKSINLLAEGDGPPPKSINWEWRDKSGSLVDPSQSYQTIVKLTDRFGKEITLASDTIRVVVTKREHRLTSSIIIQFNFDELVSTSRYLETRIEEFARQIMRLSMDNKGSVRIRILGHTDPIGTPARNRSLSKQRADKEYTALRNYLIALLDLKNQWMLDNWLSEHNITLTQEGVADTDPYEIERYRKKHFERVLLGNNDFPEGRSLNRRVVIEIDQIREK